MRSYSTAAGAVLAALLCLSPVLAHVFLRYPPTGIPLDFLDNVRTEDLCGVHPNRAGEAAAWQVPDFNTSVKTTALAGSAMDVSWDLHYAHNGGIKLELYDADMKKIHEWAPEDHMGCNVDGTKQNVTIELPAEACPGCVLRFQRQALEWGASYLFRSCALLEIVAEAGEDAEVACNGCSGHGTCAGGTCTCDSSEATGFFYGTHCEYENECEADAACGANGKCVNIGDVSGPAKQCFCEAGFFGDVITMPSGMQKRKCNRASALDLDAATVTWDNFGADYNRSLPSTGNNFVAHLNPGAADIEFAMQGKTISWVAMGMRSAGAAAAGGAAPAAEGPAAEGEATAGAPAAEAEAPAEAPAEPAAQSQAASEAPATAGTPPASPTPQAEGGRRRRRLSSATRALASAEATPAAEAPAAEGAADGEGAAAEGEGDGGGTAGCAAADIDAATLVVPGDLGPGTVVTAGAPGAADEEVAAAEGDAPAEEAPARKLQSVAYNMPLVQAEAVTTARMNSMHTRRSLQNVAAEAEAPAAEGEATAEGEDGAAAGYKAIDFSDTTTLEATAATVGAVSGGPCAGAATTPGSAHAMVNQDVVFGAAQLIGGKQYFRIVDMYTPSRSKPQPDHMFCDDGACGTDDITDAIGAEVGGNTYIKFIRAAKTMDSFTDACISEDQSYHVIYAMGQLTANATHIPDSALEVLPEASKSNKDFYKVDELKFHGGGIGTSFQGRGILGPTVNLFSDEPAVPAGEACTASTMDGFDCMLDPLQGNVIVHYNNFVEGDTSATMAAETPSETGWVALGFHPVGAPAMIGSTAVIGTETAANGVGVFDLNAKSAAGVVEAASATTVAARRLHQSTNVPFSITDASVERAGGKTIIKFTRAFDDTFTGEGTIGALAAYHSTESELGTPHESRGDFEFSLSPAAASPAAATPPAPAQEGPTTPTTREPEGTPSGATSMYHMHSVLVSMFLGAVGVCLLF